MRGKKEASLLGKTLTLAAAVSLALMLVAITMPPAAAWTETGGGDHGGADWIITTDTTIAGNHYNIRLFKIDASVNVTIQAYDGSSYGWVEIHAENVAVDGTLSADGAGYAGGNNSAGAGPGGGAHGSNLYAGAGGGGVYAGGGAGGSGGGSGTRSHGGGGGGYGGAGGIGSGASGGAGGAASSTWYGDRMGSGGGSSYNSNNTDGRGGGKILLYADNTIQVNGTITASGNDGAVVSVYGNGGGSGGSILLQATDNITVNGAVTADGGAGGDAGGDYSGGGGGSGGSIQFQGKNIRVNGTASANGGREGGGGYYGNPGGAGGGGWIQVFYDNTYTGTFTVSGANSGRTEYVCQDSNPPTITINTHDNQWYHLNPLLDVDFSDDGSWVENAFYQIDSSAGAWKNLTSDGSTLIGENVYEPSFTIDWYISNTDWNSLSPGAHTIYFKVVDRWGNSSAGSSPSFTINKSVPTIINITATPTLIDRDIDQVGSGAVDSTRIYIEVQENAGRDWVENSFIWILDNTDTEVMTAHQLTNYENISLTTKRFYYDFNPDDPAQCGYFDIKAQVVDNDGLEDTSGYTGLGYQLFEVNDLVVSSSLMDDTPINQLTVLGTIARVSGTVSADEAVVEDNNEGTMVATLDDDNFNKAYGLVSPVRLHHNSMGSVYVWACDDTLDGKSPAMSYQVEGDNAEITNFIVNRQDNQTIVNFNGRWSSDDAPITGTVFLPENNDIQGGIANGRGTLVIPHSVRMNSGQKTASLFDNADRPLWDVLSQSFSFNILPTAVELQADNIPLPAKVTPTPVFRWVFEDNNPNDTQFGVHVQVGSAPDDDDFWDWSDAGYSLVEKVYEGAGLVRGQTYHLRVRVRDSQLEWQNADDSDRWTRNHFTINKLPEISLVLVEGEVNPQSLTTSTPKFEWTFTDPDGDEQSKYHIQVGTSQNGSDLWDYNAPGSEDSVTYGGSPLGNNVTYYFRVRVFDNLEWSNWFSGTLRLALGGAGGGDGSGGGGGMGGGGGGGGPPSPPDVTPPTLEVLEPTSTNVSENVIVSVRATDPSGIDPSLISVTLDGITAPYTWSDDIVTVSFTGLSAGGHLVVVRVKDASGNHNEASITISFNVVPPAVVENIENATPEPTEIYTVVISTLGAGENATVSFDDDNLPISSVTLAASEDIPEKIIEGVSILTQVLEGAPPEIGSFPENVFIYAFMEISTTAPENALASITINFNVTKIWLQAFDTAPLAIALFRWEDGVWVELPTTKTGEDDLKIYYSAVTPGFSVFIIGGKTVFPTFNLQLPATPLEPENGFVQIMLWAANPTSNKIVKRCELRFDNHVKLFDIEIQPHENLLVAVYVNVAGMEAGIYDMKLYDAETDTILDEGRVTLLSIAEPETPPTNVETTPSPMLPALAVALSMVAGLGMLRVMRRPKIGKTPSAKLPKLRPPTLIERPKSKKAEEGSSRGKSIIHEYHEVLTPAAHELHKEDSSVIHGYYELLSPAACEIAAKKRVKHLGKAVKPYKRKNE